MNPCPAQDLTIVLLGKSGVGKSASGNTILGREAFESRKSFKSVTMEIKSTEGNVFGKRISVIDTPEILDFEKEIAAKCKRVSKSSPCLFLALVKLDRFSIEHKNAVETAIKCVGDQLDKCYLLFTGGDYLEGMVLDDVIKENPELSSLVKRFRNRRHVFNNENGGQDQVRELLEKSGHLREDAESEPEMRIVLLGLPGRGKSASGNTILGSNKFHSACGFGSVTAGTISASATVEGRKVTVVDTPGFTARVLRPRKLFEEIMKSIKEAAPGPHALVILVKIDRMSEADFKLFKMLPKLFGKDAREHTMVLFTYGDQLKGGSIDGLIKDNKSVSNLVSHCGGRYCVFDNSKKGNRTQVRELLDKIDEIVGGKHFTSEMFYDNQYFKVKIAIKWHELGEWFKRKTRKLDDHEGGYTRLNERDDEAADSAAVGEETELLPRSRKSD